MLKSSEYSLFIGLTTLPFGMESGFIKKEITRLFENYRYNLYKHSSTKTDYEGNADNVDQLLYRPLTYILHGQYDLMCFSLVEDFSLGNQIFRPFNSFILKQGREENLGVEDPEIERYKKNRSYNYQVFAGTHNTYLENGHDISEFFKQVITTPKAYPFTAICRLKINNALLIGNGLDCKDALGKAIAKHLSSDKYNGSISFSLLDSFSCHEFTLLLLGKSYDLMTTAILEIKEWELNDLLQEGLFDDDAVNDLANNSLYSSFVDDKDAYKINYSHVFINSQTQFGFHSDFYTKFDKSTIEEVQDLLKDEKTSFTLALHLKSGHTSSFLKNHFKDTALLKDQKVHLVAGGGILLPDLENTSFKTSTPLSRLTNVLKETDPASIEDMRKICTNLVFERDASELIKPDRSVKGHQDDSDPRIIFREHLFEKPFQFDLDDIEKVRIALQETHISRVVRERVLNMFVDFNDGITDPILFGYFLELKPLLVYLIESLTKDQAAILEMQAKPATPSAYGNEVDDLNDRLMDFANAFDTAYLNRFKQSYRMLDITDFTLEHNGGIQQLISCFDVSYRAIAKLLGDNYISQKLNTSEAHSFALVGGFPGVESNLLFVRLNYFHVFQMEVFAMIATHEAANLFVSKALEYQYKHKNLAIRRLNLTTPRNLEKLTEKVELNTIRQISLLLGYHINRPSLTNVLIGLEGTSTPKNIPILGLTPNKPKDASIIGSISKIQGHKSYLNLLYAENKVLWDYLFVDLITFNLAFNEDKGKFWYFHWGYFCQLYSNYNNTGEFDSGTLKVQLLRMLLCLKIGSGDNFDIEEFETPPFSQLAPFWETNFPSIKAVFKLYTDYKDTEIKKLRSLMEVINCALAIKEIGYNTTIQARNTDIGIEATVSKPFLSKEVLKGIISPGTDSDKNMTVLNMWRYLNTAHLFRRKLFKTASDDVHANYSDGNPYRYKDLLNHIKDHYKIQNTIDCQASLFVQITNFGFLKEIYNANKLRNSLLYRDRKGSVIPVEKLIAEDELSTYQQAPYLFDQTGGIFTHSLSIRKHTLRRRGAYYNSMWDFAHLMKKEMVNKMIHKVK